MTTPHPPTVKVSCLCGKVHAFDREKVLERLNKARFKCAGCQRRFVVACTPAYAHHAETFWPIFLEDVPPLGDTQEMGIDAEPSPAAGLPAQLQFNCRCGCRLVGEERMYGKRTRCPKCDARIVVRVGFHTETGKPVALLEYVEEKGSRP